MLVVDTLLNMGKECLVSLLGVGVGFSSPKHNLLMVSFYGRFLSVVRRAASTVALLTL
jgi:hypothetical protein